MALRCPSFQRARAVPVSASDLRPIGLIHHARPVKPGALPKCEKIFIAGTEVTERDIEPQVTYSSRATPSELRMKHFPSPISYYACLAICTTFLFWGLPAWASDDPGSPDSSASEQSSGSASSTSQSTPAPGTGEKPGRSGKYDVDRIGQRGIGDGVNLYSLQ